MESSTIKEKQLRLQYLIAIFAHKFKAMNEIYIEIGEVFKQWDETMTMADRTAALVRKFNEKTAEMLAIYDEYKQIYDELFPAVIPGK